MGFGRQIAADLAPTITGTIIPALRSMGRGVRNTVRTLTSLSDFAKGTIAAVTGLTAAVSAGVAIWAGWPAIIGGVTAAFSALGTAASVAWGAITSPVTAVVAAVAAVAGVAGLIYDNWGGLVDFFKATFDSVIAVAKAWGEVLFQTFKTAWTEIKSLFLSSIDGLISIINDGLRAIGAEGQTIDKSFGMSDEQLQAQRDRLATAVSDFQSAGQEAARTFSGEIGDGWGAVKQSTSDAVSFVKGQLTDLGSVFSLGGGGQRTGSESGSGAGGGSGSGGGTSSQGGRQGAGVAVSSWVVKMTKWRREAQKAKKKTNQLKATGKSATRSVASGFNRVASGIGQTVAGLITGKKAAASFGETMVSALQSVLSQLVALIPKLAIIKGIGAIAGIGTGGISSIGGALTKAIPGLASGGIVTGPTLAMVGEGTESEAVLPLSKLDGMMAGSRGGGGQLSASISMDELIFQMDRSLKSKGQSGLLD
jgi:hypothetical protein